MTDQVFQFKITLLEVKPKVWRRIQIADNCSFWDLHVAIQDAMGWTDSHLHGFDVVNPKNLDNEVLVCYEAEPGEQYTWDVAVKDYIACNNSMTYQYDFGDDWQHLIEFEKTCEKDPKKRYPICTDGQRACPPEDVGGVGGYERFVKIMKNKNHDEYKEMVDWVGYKFDPSQFDSTKVPCCVSIN